jgi:benzoate membrane transport protein
MPVETTFWRNLRDFPRVLSLAGLSGGFLVVLVGYTGPLLIVLEAARAGGLSQAETASWVWACTIGNGLLTVLMSLWYRQPITSPWSTAGAALLVTSLAVYPLPQAIGAYMLSAIAVALLGCSGLFGRAMALIPQPIVLGMLAGILLRFGIGVFSTLPTRPVMVISMIVAFYLMRAWGFRAPTLGVLLIGLVIAALADDLQAIDLTLTLTRPHLTVPEFSLDATFGLAMPLFILAVTSQYATGQAVLRSHNYQPPTNGILIITGIASLLLAPFGGHGQTLGALTAAFVMNPDIDPDLSKRYSAAVVSGLLYIAFGLFGATVVALFAAFPAALVATVAGLALSSVIASSLTGAMAAPQHREAALVAFLCTAANFTLWSIGAPFWGLLGGLLVWAIQEKASKPKQASLK